MFKSTVSQFQIITTPSISSYIYTPLRTLSMFELAFVILNRATKRTFPIRYEAMEYTHMLDFATVNLGLTVRSSSGKQAKAIKAIIPLLAPIASIIFLAATMRIVCVAV